jgi:hypothetical protein
MLAGIAKMSNIPEEVENDPSYRRQMLYAWAVILKERDELVKKLNKELEDLETLKFSKDRVDALIEEIQGKDIILTSSRFSRVFHNATLFDRIIVGLQSLFTVRPKAAVEGVWAVLVAASLGMLVAYVSDKHESFRWFKDLLNLLGMSKASAATTPGVSASLDPVQVYIIIGFAGLIAVGFVWFAVTATLSREAATRRTAMDMTKSVMLFMMGLVTGYLSNRH